MIEWTGLAPWEFKFPFLGSLISTFLLVTCWCLRFRSLPNRGKVAPLPRCWDGVQVHEPPLCARFTQGRRGAPASCLEPLLRSWNHSRGSWTHSASRSVSSSCLPSTLTCKPARISLGPAYVPTVLPTVGSYRLVVWFESEA